MKPLYFHERTSREMTEAAQFYESRADGLGLVFLDDVEHAITLIREHPEAFPIVRDIIRKIPLNRFPYNIIYVIEPDRIRVLAVAHQKRRPTYWRTRRNY